MEMFVVFNVPPFCSLDSFTSHLFLIFVLINTIKKQGLSRDLRSPSAIFCLVCSLTLVKLDDTKKMGQDRFFTLKVAFFQERVFNMFLGVTETIF